jgi:glycosyltransferase involved in cell wall biosynthesis
MQSNKLTVVISNYNHSQFLPEALSAILSQTVLPSEIIIIDDCSTDDSVKVIEEFASEQPIIKLHRNEVNMGIFYSSNLGLKLAKGEYIYFGAADDRVYPNLFEKTLELMAKHPQAGLCSALLKRIGSNGEDEGWIQSPLISKKECYLPPKTVIENIKAYGSWFTGQTVIYRRDSIMKDTDGFLPELAHRTDHLVNYVVAAKNGACFIPEILATYRVLTTGYAEKNFDNDDISRSTFRLLLNLLRSPRYSPIFPENCVSNIESRGWYEIEVRIIRRTLQVQIAFSERLKILRHKKTFLDKLFFITFIFLAKLVFLISSVYLWHRRINWDFRWVAMKIKTRLAKQRLDKFPSIN